MHRTDLSRFQLRSLGSEVGPGGLGHGEAQAVVPGQARRRNKKAARRTVCLPSCNPWVAVFSLPITFFFHNFFSP